jgi:hypothetical protein
LHVPGEAAGGGDAKEIATDRPLHIFDEKGRVFQTITPAKNATSRDIAIKLLAGKISVGADPPP